MAETEEENKFKVPYTAFKVFSRQKLLGLNTLADVERELPTLVSMLDTVTKELIDKCMNTSESLHSKLDDVHGICLERDETTYDLFMRAGMRIIYILRQMECEKENDLQLIKKILSSVYEDLSDYSLIKTIEEIFNAKNDYIDKKLKDNKYWYETYKEVTA